MAVIGRRVLVAAAVVALVHGISACSQGIGAEPAAVLARVNDTEITISQLRAALLAQGNAQPTAEEARQALDALVNEQLLADAAVASRLDDDPAVTEAIEASRRQLLAKAYIERAVLPKDPVAAAEQTAYYRANPALFAERRIYQLTAFTVASEQLTDAVVTKLERARSADGVALVLTAQRVEFETQNLTRAAEQVPLAQLPQFAAASVGDILIQPPVDGRTTLMLVSGMQNAALEFETAQPFIEEYLTNLRNAAALDAHLKTARAAAKITAPDAALLAAPTLAATELEPALR